MLHILNRETGCTSKKFSRIILKYQRSIENLFYLQLVISQLFQLYMINRITEISSSHINLKAIFPD